MVRRANVLTLPTLTTPPANPDKHQSIFCAGHAWTLDGHLLVCGGDKYDTLLALGANKLAYRFNPNVNPPSNAMWVKEQTDMLDARWYPTVTAMAADSFDGKSRLMVSGGTLSPFAYKTYTVFEPSAVLGFGTWQVNPILGLARFPGPTVTCNWREFNNYPRNFLVSSGKGKVFTAGMGDRSYRVQHDNITPNPPVWELQPALPPYVYERYYGTCVLFPNMGGGVYQDFVMRIGGQPIERNPTVCSYIRKLQVTNTAEVCDAGASSLGNWQSLLPMQYGRIYQNAVILPDATILVVGGKTDVLDINNKDISPFTTGSPVLQAELYNDTPGQWRTLASMQVRRGYHSTAILLPSGKVLVGGGEQREKDYEVFQPPYLTNNTKRPVIQGTPPTIINYGQTYSVEYLNNLGMGVYVQKVVLMAPAALTHHTDMHARYVELDIDSVEPIPPPPNPTVVFQAPASSKFAPKGYYMLFLVTNPQGGFPKGTPSVATWVQLK